MTRTTTVEMPRTERMLLFKRKLCRAHGWMDDAKRERKTVEKNSVRGARGSASSDGRRNERVGRCDARQRFKRVPCQEAQKKSLIDDAFADRWVFGSRGVDTSVKLSINLDRQV